MKILGIYTDNPPTSSRYPPENERMIERDYVPEPLWYLRALPHTRYTQTEWWKIRKERFLEMRRAQGQFFCEMCGGLEIDTIKADHRWWVNYVGRVCGKSHPDARTCRFSAEVTRELRMQVHHLTYDNIGSESDEDLQLLCELCHLMVTKPRRREARFWAEYQFTAPHEMEPEVREVWDRYHPEPTEEAIPEL